MNSPYLMPNFPADEGWREDAACQGLPQVFWYSGDDDDEELPVRERRDLARQAKSVCQGCPVQLACLNYALDNAENYGIWGGLNPRERTRLRRERTAVEVDMPSHGTERDYVMHLKLNSIPCPACRSAHARHVAKMRRRRKAAAGVR